ncbi:MAG: hypothetical protein ABF979_15340 [Gluconobacter sp.]|uniref:hypothetical protein n=1 Tax=Gluconobacter sp. TaxID=1876758 RepID=UPI0039EB74D1
MSTETNIAEAKVQTHDRCLNRAMREQIGSLLHELEYIEHAANNPKEVRRLVRFALTKHKKLEAEFLAEFKNTWSWVEANLTIPAGDPA